MKITKTLALIALILFSVSIVAAAENLMTKKEVSYQVFPGDWNKKLLTDKNLGRFLDPDLDRATNKRKGLLADGKKEQRGVCYNYHWTKKDLRFVTIVVDLGKEYNLSKVNIVAFRNNEAYNPSFFDISVSSDNVKFTDAAKGTTWEKKGHYQRIAKANLTNIKCRYVKIKVGTSSTWINISEIEIFDK